ncbi:MAG TPA: DnaJ domain-containing protein [Candidatus Sulfotelmatobacter sp.]|nr:DnaJ domain-containing protein [Candidatus Sulfotelmatobacter sp.]
MVYLLLGAVLLGLLFFAARAFLNTDPKVLARVLRYTAVVLLALAALVLAASGRAVLDVPFGAAILYLLRHWLARGLPGLDRFKDWLKGTPHQRSSSTIETAWLRMTLDQASGALDGEVLSGQFSGARLDQLGFDQLRALLAECAAADAQSVRLLETYLDRTHPGWRDQAQASGRREGADAGGSGARMTRDEAWQVLGLEPGASPEAIREAHRRLMLKLHPDHGGSNYLASKINAARDLLLQA